MQSERLTRSLERFVDVLQALLLGLTPEEARWRPPGGGWSILEILCHLADEEVDDFRARLRLTLNDPGNAWPPIDPEKWPTERAYREQDLEACWTRWRTERLASVAWLRELGEADWSKAHEHPVFGTLRAGDLLTSWAAHDALHLRQIAQRMYQRIEADAGAFQPGYAGPWG